MSINTSPNYPDLLGYITGGERYNIGVVQLALAVRPRVVRAGRPFEVIMLVQNASDVNVDVNVRLHIPDRDVNKKKGRFVAPVDQLVVGLQPAEVGYVVLPMSCLPDTGISADYRVGMELNAKPLGKPQRIRLPEGGGLFEPNSLDEATREKVDDLKPLKFSASKRSSLRGTVLETAFSVMSGRVGALVDLKPGWVSLWSLRDHLDDRMLLLRYMETMKDVVLPALNRNTVYKPLLAETIKRFETINFPLKPIEATFIAKLLTLIVEYAAPQQATHGSHGYLAAGSYNLMPLLTAERLASDEPVVLPRWASGMLRAIVRDERAARYPVQALVRFLYDDLIYDAAVHAFHVIETATGEDLGNDSEIDSYVEQLLRMLSGDVPINFTHAYLPLILGGILIYDRVLLGDEKLGELLDEMREILAERRPDLTSDSEPIYNMAAQLIEQAMMKYGYKGQ